jgi:nicotinamidase-related amidase
LKENYPLSFDYFYRRMSGVVLPAFQKILACYRKHGRPIIYVTTGSMRGDGKDMLPHFQRRVGSERKIAGGFQLLRVGGEWHCVDASIAPQPGDVSLNKTTRSAFHSTGIDQLLKNLGITQVLVGGVATNACVDLTARDAADQGYETFLIEDACATFTEDAERAALQTFQSLFGTVLTSDDVIQKVSARSSESA